MTQSEFKSWLAAHYKRGQEQYNRQLFLAHFGEVARACDATPISEATLNNWLGKGRNPPDYYGGIAFEQFLGLVLDRKNNPAPPAAIYTVQIALSEAENQALIETAQQAESTPADFLRLCLRLGFEDECGIE